MNNSAGGEGNDLYINNDWNQNYVYCLVNLYNNDFDWSENGFFIVEDSFTIDSSNLDNVDPLFVDPASDDYHLTEFSPCIDTGNDAAPELPLTDKDGYPRIAVSHVDIGAYEYQGFIAPVAAFSASPLSGVGPLTVEFMDESAGSIDTRLWNFGDSSNSCDRNPTHEYLEPGIYTVSLTVTGDSVSDTETKTDYITVISPDAPDLIGTCKAFLCRDFGKIIIIRHLIENGGNSGAGPFKIALYRSTNGISYEEGDLLTDRTLWGGLGAGQSRAITLRYTSESSLTGYYLVAVVDFENAVQELDELNNINPNRILIP